MSKTELLIRLRDLHEVLSGINLDQNPKEVVDEETIDALGQLATDVANLVDQANDRGDDVAASEEHNDLLDRISSFEANHPKVTSFLSQMTDLLAMLGI